MEMAETWLSHGHFFFFWKREKGLPWLVLSEKKKKNILGCNCNGRIVEFSIQGATLQRSLNLNSKSGHVSIASDKNRLGLDSVDDDHLEWE